jgi:hypothetical protein
MRDLERWMSVPRAAAGSRRIPATQCARLGRNLDILGFTRVRRRSATRARSECVDRRLIRRGTAAKPGWKNWRSVLRPLDHRAGFAASSAWDRPRSWNMP